MTRFLKKARVSKGLTLQELGELIGRKKAFLSLLEKGKTEGSVATWDRLEEALGVDQRILRQAADNTEAALDR